MPVAFNAYKSSIAERPDTMDTVELFSAPYIPDYFPSGGAGVFPLQTGVYPACITIYAFGMRYSF